MPRIALGYLGLPIQPTPPPWTTSGYGAPGAAPPPPAPAAAAGAVNTQVSKLPIWLYPAAPSIPIEAIAFIVMPAKGSSAVIVQEQIPNGFNAVIWQLANVYLDTTTGFVEGNGTVLWQVTINGVPYRGLEKIPASIGLIEGPSRLSSPIYVKEQQIVAMVVENVNIAAPTANPTVGARLSGYLYPKDLEMEESWY